MGKGIWICLNEKKIFFLRKIVFVNSAKFLSSRNYFFEQNQFQSNWKRKIQYFFQLFYFLSLFLLLFFFKFPSMPHVHDNGSTAAKIVGLGATGGGIALAVKNPKNAPIGGAIAVAGFLLTIFGGAGEVVDKK
jgi:hypothetical protein